MILSEISFPVYKLRDSEPVKENGVSFYPYDSTYEDEDGQVVEGMTARFIDDTALSGRTLAARRLALANLGVPLLKINRAIFFLGDLVKAATPSTWFIDSLGNIFNYKKASRAKLVFRKVTRVFPNDTGGVIVEVQGMQTRFKALFAPDIPREYLYAGILLLGMSSILYGFYEGPQKDSWRKV